MGGDILRHFFLEVMRVDNILPEHGELPRVLDLAVHLDQLTTWMGRVALEHSFMVKSLWWGGVVAYVIIVSP